MMNLYMKKLPKPFSKEKVLEYFQKLYAGDMTAREEIIKHNCRLIILIISKKFYDKRLDKEELFSIGLIGLIKAVDTFDIEKNREFSSYASKCIINEILMYLRKESKRLNDNSLQDTIFRNKDGSEITYEEMLCDKTVDFVLDYENVVTNDIIREVVASLSDKERFIITKYFGFENNKRMTMLEIANSLGISRSYMSKIMSKVLIKINNRLQEQGIIEYQENISKRKKQKDEKNSKKNIERKDVVSIDTTVEEMNKKVRTFKLPNIYEYLDGYTKEEIQDMLLSLSWKEKDIINKYFFLSGSRPMLAKEIADLYGISEFELITYVNKLIAKMKSKGEIEVNENELKDKEPIDNISELEAKKKKGNKLHSIYKLFKEYTKEEIDLMLAKLSEEER